MCRMLGMVSTDNGAAQAAPLPSWWHLVGAPHALRVQAEIGKALQEHSAGHKDSWGIGWFDRAESVSLLRQTGSAADSAYYILGAEKAVQPESGGGARTLIGHLRKASCGAVNSENAHPIRVDHGAGAIPISAPLSFLLAHNGTLKEPLLESMRIDLGKHSEAHSDSDTVLLAAWLGMQAGRASVALYEILEKSLSALLRHGAAVAPDGDLTAVYTGINLLIAAPDGLYALRQFSKNPEYYTLFVRPMTREEAPSGGWIVASEPTDEEKTWELMPPGELFYFSSKDASVKRRVVVPA